MKMNHQRHYPARVEDVLDPTLGFDPKVLRSVKRFAQSRPWGGSLSERQAKFQQLHADLAMAFGVPPPRLILAQPDASDSSRSCYIPAIDTIIMRGLSVVTFLHEWGHRLHGASEVSACRWSINLFRVCFPRSFARCRFDGHMLRRGGSFRP